MILVGDWAPDQKKVAPLDESATLLGNLEGPVLDCHRSFKAASKAGPSLYATHLPDPTTHFVFSLANNHILDYGTPGLATTQRRLCESGFQACGAGQDVLEARRPIVNVDRGAQVGIIACCEAQFGIASRNQAGAAEFGPWVYTSIRELRNKVDAVIVSVHAGVEHSPWPSPYIRDLYRSYIDAGATVVHGHHPHIPQGYESYRDGVIFYGMGNFAMNPDRLRNYPNGMWSLASEVCFDGESLRWSPFTFEIRHRTSTDSIVVERSSTEERKNHQRYLELCNLPFGDEDLFQALWQETALRVFHDHGASYMRFLPTHGKTRTGIRRYLSAIKRALLEEVRPKPDPSQLDYLIWYHMLACESHRQMLATALGVLGGEIVDLRNRQTQELADEMMPWSCALLST